MIPKHEEDLVGIQSGFSSDFALDKDNTIYNEEKNIDQLKKNY